MGSLRKFQTNNNYAPIGGRPVLAFDFDGVLCDSSDELGTSAWKAAQRLWPNQIKGDATKETLREFRQCRPILETGFESILIVWALKVENYSPERIISMGVELFDDLMKKLHVSRSSLIDLLGRTRDEWREQDIEGWIKSNTFYPHIIDSLNNLNNSGWGSQVFIVTTKETRFAEALLKSAGVQIPTGNIYGLEAGKKKAVLDRLAKQFPDSPLLFVEDRLPTLHVVKAETTPDTQRRLCLLFAEWGYSGEKEKKEAKLPPILSFSSPAHMFQGLMFPLIGQWQPHPKL